MGRVIGINGREPVISNDDEGPFLLVDCVSCGWPHFKWSISERDDLTYRTECTSCGTTYTFRVKEIKKETDEALD